MAEKKGKVADVEFRRRGPGGPGGMFAEAEKADKFGPTLKRIFKYFLSSKLLMLALFLVVVFGTLCGIIAPKLQSNAIDMIAGSMKGELYRTLVIMFITYLFFSASRFFQDYLSAKLSQNVVRKMRRELFEKLLDLPVKYLDQHSHGDVMSRMTNDIENVSTTISQSLPSLFSGVLTIIGTLAMMLVLCWQLTLLSFVTVMITIIVTRALSGKIRMYSRRRQALLGELNGKAEEIITGYHTVVAYNHQKASDDEFNTTSDELTKASIRINSIAGVFGPMMNSISNLGFIVVAAFGGMFALNGIISVGVISAFIVYSKQFGMPMNHLATIFNQLQTAIAGAERVFHILDEENEDMSGEDLVDAEEMEVRFEDVDFSYVQGKQVLNDFTLSVPSGKKVALVGATGSGKTTVVNLLMRFYDIDSGHIYINGQDLADVSRADLRKNVAIVLQDTMLFTDTVRNNLKYGNADATEDDIRLAARMSHAEGFIEALPEGWDTVMIGSGANISHGQRQLLAIARAFVADAKILILDEATSNVDTRTEKAVQNAMQKIMENRTSIVIAHRLSTIIDSDLIVVMDHGEIVEMGTHEDLLNAGGKYAELYNTQYAGSAT